MKSVAVLNDLSLEEYKGGTEYFSFFLSRLLNNNNIESKTFSFSSFENSETKFLEMINNVDIVVMTNVGRFPSEWIKKIKPKPMIKIEMDYGFCSTRNGMCQSCTPERRCSETRLSWYKELLQMVDKIIFLNPHQKERYRQFFGGIVNNSMINMSFYAYENEFQDEKRFRLPNSFLFAHRFYQEKGIDDALHLALQNPQGHFFFLGFGNDNLYLPQILNLNNCCYLGTLPDDRRTLNHYYNMFEYFISLPRWEDTGPIKVVEAELCGMKLIINDNNKIRTNGWKDPEELRTHIRISQRRLVELVEELLDN